MNWKDRVSDWVRIVQCHDCNDINKFSAEYEAWGAVCKKCGGKVGLAGAGRFIVTTIPCWYKPWQKMSGCWETKTNYH